MKCLSAAKEVNRFMNKGSGHWSEWRKTLITMTRGLHHDGDTRPWSWPGEIVPGSEMPGDRTAGSQKVSRWTGQGHEVNRNQRQESACLLVEGEKPQSLQKTPQTIISVKFFLSVFVFSKGWCTWLRTCLQIMILGPLSRVMMVKQPFCAKKLSNLHFFVC